MKTLDEVIKAFEECIVPKNVFCNGCYKDDRCKITEDALHYLKEYKDKQDEDWRQSYIAVRNEILFGGEDVNPPISWDELKYMAGKPVWVEGEHGFIWNHRSWVLIDPYDENDDLIICHGTDTGHYEFAISKEDYGTDWQAYRKERK